MKKREYNNKGHIVKGEIKMGMEKLLLGSEKLKNYCDPGIFDFETTEQAPALAGLVGQERAVKSVEFGFSVDKPGYNIYLAGAAGTGKTSYAKAMAKERAKEAHTPSDWCYVYNFDKTEEPKLIELPAGEGRNFCRTMRRFIDEVKEELPNVLKEQEFEERKAQFIKEFQNKRANLVNELNDIGDEYGFSFKHTSSGLTTKPLVCGKELDEEDFDYLEDEQKREIEARSSEVQVHVNKVIGKIREEERALQERINNLKEEMALKSLTPILKPIKDRYEHNQTAMDYLNKVEEDILENLDKYIVDPGESQPQMFPFIKMDNSPQEDFFFRYKVNLFVDNSELEGAPVIIETNPTYYNLLGKMEYINKMGTTTTDFTQIKPGAIHRANGGYLILQVNELLSNPLAYNGLKRVLNTGESKIENIGEQMGVIAVSSLRPEPLPVKLKVLVVGTRDVYHFLYNYEEGFSKLFKIKADFDETMERNNVNVHKMASFIYSLCEKENLSSFTAGGVARVIEYSSKLADHQEKLSTRFNELVEIIYESASWAKIEGKVNVSGEDVTKAIEEKIYRKNRTEEKTQELIDQDIIMIDTREKIIGQVNGLAVSDLGDYKFGRPFKITANTYSGKKGIINIEREAKLSGKTHDKGVMILSSYLGDIFYWEMPLSLTCSICCEQSYGMIEGDSASSTEMYAILSSLAKVPIRQNIAVTGSMNQKGEIQPVGGITEKIEGYYSTCKKKGFTGNEGVIIPRQNEKNLNLSEEVIEGVKDGKFKIYSISSVSQGIEILTGMASGFDLEGPVDDPPEDSIYKRAKSNLKAIKKNSQESQESRESREDENADSKTEEEER